MYPRSHATLRPLESVSPPVFRTASTPPNIGSFSHLFLTMPSDARDHKQGNQDRKYTPDQKAAVLRIKKCQPTAFYEILLVERSSTDNEIKKAYRKQSLLTHPDKNGYEGADEAFKSKLKMARL